MGPLKDLTGKTFGRLTAIRYVGESKWLCRCECGRQARVITANLTKGNSTSCGCMRWHSHRMSGTALYRVWLAMRQRCENPNDAAFHNYGGRGIKVCERWQKFEHFFADMGPRPGAGYEVDRENNNGDYEPDNCRWATKRQNLNNKRTNQIITWRGESLPVTAWAERLGMHPRTLFNRLGRGWSLDRAMTQPIQTKRKD